MQRVLGRDTASAANAPQRVTNLQHVTNVQQMNRVSAFGLDLELSKVLCDSAIVHATAGFILLAALLRHD